MHVFPGGRVEERDFEAVPVIGRPDSRGTRADPALSRALVVCAAREMFEETGVLLTEPSVLVPEADRARIEAGGDFGQLLLGMGAAVDACALPMWSHWVTPEIEPRRFDVRFYIAALPPGQRVCDVSGEADHVRWIRPGEALDLHSSGELPMLPPTSATLAELLPFATAADAVASATGRAIAPLLPHRYDDGSWAVIDAYDRSVIHPVTEARVISEVAGIHSVPHVGES